MIEFRSVGKRFADGTRAVCDFSLTLDPPMSRRLWAAC